jgi:hypothetical protein
MDMKTLFGFASLLVAALGYIPYISDVLRGKTKPHAYSWLVWSVLAVVGFGIQVQGDGGAGTWLLGLTALVTLFVFILSFKFGHTDIRPIDTYSLIAAGVIFVFWLVVKQPLVTVALITVIEAVGGFFPTFRKSYKNPYEETALLYGIYAVSIAFSLLALKTYSSTNVLYPACVFFMDISLVAFLLIRRRTNAVST